MWKQFQIFTAKKLNNAFFNGCKIHAHLDLNCTFNAHANEKTLNPFGKTFKEVNETFFKQMENLILKNADQINEIVVEWQCNYLKKKSKSSHKIILRNTI